MYTDAAAAINQLTNFYIFLDSFRIWLFPDSNVKRLKFLSELSSAVAVNRVVPSTWRLVFSERRCFSYSQKGSEKLNAKIYPATRAWISKYAKLVSLILLTRGVIGNCEVHIHIVRLDRGQWHHRPSMSISASLPGIFASISYACILHMRIAAALHTNSHNAHSTRAAQRPHEHMFVRRKFLPSSNIHRIGS